jgi:Leucine-rich repeat (LRR) protein
MHGNPGPAASGAAEGGGGSGEAGAFPSGAPSAGAGGAPSAGAGGAPSAGAGGAPSAGACAGGEGGAVVEEPWEPDVSNGELNCGTPFIIPNRRLAKEIYQTWDRDEGNAYRGGALPDEVKGLTSLRVSEYVGADVAGIECLTQLKSLSLYANEGASLSGLSALTSLANAELIGPGVVDLAPLEGLSQLTYLSLQDTKVGTLQPLSGLRDLVTLHVWGSEASDLAPLANLLDLEQLSLGRSPVSDVTPIANLPQLRQLSLNQTAIGSSTELDGFPALQRLDLSNNQLLQLPDLTGLVSLEKLDVSQNALTTLSGIGGPGLLDLQCLANPIVDWSAIADVPQLASLNLSAPDAPATFAYHGLELATSLESLILQHVDTSELTFLSSLNELKDLTVYRPFSGGTDLVSIVQLPSLKILSVVTGGIRDLSPLSGNTTIEDLDLQDNGFSDISALLTMTALKYLTLGGPLDCAEQEAVLETLRTNGVDVSSSCD